MRRTTFFFLMVSSAFVHIQGKTTEYRESHFEAVCTNDKVVEDDTQREIISELAKPPTLYRRNNVDRSTNMRLAEREASCERRQNINEKRRNASTRERTRRIEDRMTRDVQTQVVQRERRTDVRRQTADMRSMNDDKRSTRRVRNTDRQVVEGNTNRRMPERVDDSHVSDVRQSSRNQRTRTSMETQRRIIDDSRLGEGSAKVRISDARREAFDKTREANNRRIRKISSMHLLKADREIEFVRSTSARRSSSRMDGGSSDRESRRTSDRRNLRSYNRNERFRNDRFLAAVDKHVAPVYEHERRTDARSRSPQRLDEFQRDYISVSLKTSERKYLNDNSRTTPRIEYQQRRRNRSSSTRSNERRNLSKARQHAAPSKLPGTHVDDMFDFFTMSRALAVGAVALLGTNMWTKTV